MVRAVPQLMRDPLAWLDAVVARYGDLVALPMPRTPVLIANTPAAARRVLQENHRGYDKGTVQYRALSTVTGEGLLNNDGETWRLHRRTVQPAFHPDALPGLAARTVAAADWRLPPGAAVLDADRLSVRVLLDVVAATLVGSGVEAGEGERLIRAVDDALRAVVNRARTPWALLDRLPTPGRRRREAAIATLDASAARLVAARRASGDQRQDDVLGLLLAAVDAGAVGPQTVRDELVTAVIAGHETVAGALSWTLYRVAAHPEVQARLHAELDGVLAAAGAGAGGAAGAAAGGPRRPGWDDLARLPWTRAVLDETLRLHPPAWVVSRRAVAPDVLDGLAIPAGTLVIVSPWLLHRRPADWPDPLAFRPERFLEPGRRPAYLPFGTGPRLCIGRDLALAQGVLLLADLLRTRNVRLAPGSGRSATPPRADAGVTLRPAGGLMLEFAPRSGGLPFGPTSAKV